MDNYPVFVIALFLLLAACAQQEALPWEDNPVALFDEAEVEAAIFSESP
ncbi:MAG: hypothetical protein R2865_15055 [Deinococcales bacterium]